MELISGKCAKCGTPLFSMEATTVEFGPPVYPCPVCLTWCKDKTRNEWYRTPFNRRLWYAVVLFLWICSYPVGCVLILGSLYFYFFDSQALNQPISENREMLAILYLICLAPIGYLILSGFLRQIKESNMRLGCKIYLAGLAKLGIITARQREMLESRANNVDYLDARRTLVGNVRNPEAYNPSRFWLGLWGFDAVCLVGSDNWERYCEKVGNNQCDNMTRRCCGIASEVILAGSKGWN